MNGTHDSHRNARRTSVRHRRATALALAGAAAAAALGPAAPALAESGDVERRGSCSGATAWKVKASPEDGRIEVEAEVDSNRTGQAWSWRLLHNGTVSATGSATTKAPSGSFEVRRLVADLAGKDTMTFRATNARSGEVCRGTVTL